MPLLPIDLQTMFLNMDHVGKDQATIKNAIVNSQALQATEIVKKTEQNDNAVNVTKDLEEGVNKISEEEKKKNKNKSKNQKEDNDNASENNKKEIVKDPDLGHHIDITG